MVGSSGVVGVVAVLAGADRAVEPVGLALQHVLDDQVAVDGVAHRLAQLELSHGLYFGLIARNMISTELARHQLGIGRRFDALGQMRRNELRDLDLVVEQRGHALLRLAHDA